MSNKTVKVFLFALLSVGVIFGTMNSAQASVGLDCSSALATAPAERTMNIGPAMDGKICLPGAVNWLTGQPYATGNRMLFSLPNANINIVNNWLINQAGNASFNFTVVNAAGEATMRLQINTGCGNGSTITLTPLGTADVDVSGIGHNNPGMYTAQGVLLTSGLGTVDAPGSDPLIQTVTQYSNPGTQGVSTSTIDAINQSAKKFLHGGATGTLRSNPGQILINSAMLGVWTSNMCPTFQVGDSIQLTLTGAKVAQGVTGLIVAGTPFNAACGTTVAGCALVTYPMAYAGGTTDSKMVVSVGITALNAVAFAVGTTTNKDPGNDGININFLLGLTASGGTALEPRNVNVSNVTLNLGATGNGLIDLGAYGNIMRWDQNGTLYRANYVRYEDNTTQNAYYKFSNSSGDPVTIELRYHANTDTTAGDWVTYDKQIPGWGVTALSKAAIDRVLMLGKGNYNGWIEFRLHSNPRNITAVINAKYADTWFNIPIHLYDTDSGSTGMGPKWR